MRATLSPSSRALCFTVLLAGALSASTQGVDLLSSSYLKIKTKVQQFTGIHWLVETYSNGRAHLQIESDQLERARSFYLPNGANLRQVFTVDPDASCRRATVNELLQLILNPPEDADKRRLIGLWLQSMAGVPEHVIGLTRLLYIIQANRGHMQDTGTRNIRGRECHRHELKIKLGTGSDDEMIIAAFYLKKELGQLDLQRPVRIWFKTNFSDSLLVDFFSVDTINGQQPLKDALYRIDPTTLPLGVGCASDQVRPLVYAQPGESYSMSTETFERGRLWAVHFIAFDRKQGALRRDKLPMGAGTGAEAEGHYLKTIYDLRKARRFSIDYSVRRGRASMRDDGVALWHANLRERLEVRDCVALELDPMDFVSLLWLDRMNLLGIGTVRGFEVDIYESSAGESGPAIFFPQARCLGPLGRKLSPSSPLLSSSDKLQVVWYFARTESQPARPKMGAFPFRDQLVRLDLWLNGELLKQVNVYNFVWQLVGAPNGDRREDLFALHHSCGGCDAVLARRPAPDGAEQLVDSSLWFKMELEPYTAKQLDAMMNDPTFVEELNSVPRRNEAIMRALLSQSRSLSSTQISQVRSIVHIESSVSRYQQRSNGKDPSAFIKGAFKVIVMAQLRLVTGHAFGARLFGAGDLHRGSSATPVSKVDTFEECLAAAGWRRKREHILFAYTPQGQCFIDDRPIFETANSEPGSAQMSVQFTYSNLFKLARGDAQAPLQIMQLDLIEDKMSPLPADSPQVAWLQIGRELMSTALVVPVQTSDSSESSGQLFKVNSVSLVDSLGRPASISQASRFAASSALDGLGLVTGHSVRRENALERPMDPATCRAVCATDLDCRSYSVCTDSEEVGGVECMLSNLDLIGGKDLDRVRLESRDKPSARSFRIKLANNESVELRRDKRCQVLHKNALDMFRTHMRSSTKLKGETVALVANEEECARLCLELNIEYFHGLATSSMGAQLVEGTELKGGPKKTNDDFKRNWCSLFRYLDVRTTLAGKTLLDSNKLGPLDEHTSGLCLLPRRQHGPEIAASAESIDRAAKSAGKTFQERLIEIELTLDLDTFHFSYVNLYEMSPHLRMIPYPDGATHRINSTEEQTSSDGRTRNERRVIEARNVEECARACFMQTSELSTGCRSFEFVDPAQMFHDEHSFGSNSQHETMKLCAFNSMSLADAKEANIYDQLVVSMDTSKPLTVCHYELREAYSTNGRIIKELVTIRNKIACKTERGLSYYLIVFLAITSGLLMGVYLERPLIRHWKERGQARQSSIDFVRMQ